MNLLLVLIKLQEFLISNYPQLYGQLNCPLLTADVWNKLHKVEIVDANLVMLYCWKDGMQFSFEDQDSNIPISSFGYLLGCEEAVESYQSEEHSE